jgi:endonuclease/exonuclease/phosphatase family metal-dependent hydrolase
VAAVFGLTVPFSRCCATSILNRYLAYVTGSDGLKDFRLLTYNIKDGGLHRESFILEVLQHVSPDIVILQEVMSLAIVEGLADSLSMDYFFAKGNSKRHLALLSRFPISSAKSVCPFPPIKRTILDALLDLGGDDQLQIYGVHLVAHPAFFFEWWRIWELSVLARISSDCQSGACLIVGDFNAVDPKDRVVMDKVPLHVKNMLRFQGGRVLRMAMTRMRSIPYADCFRHLHPSADGYTFPTPKPNVRFDYIFMSDGLKPKLRRCDVVIDIPATQKASDHYPVVVDYADAII